MQAWVSKTKGQPKDVLKCVPDWPKPVPNEKQNILIQVKAASLNPVGWKAIALLPSLMVHRPAVPEADFAGIVVSSDNEAFKAGDHVMGSCNMAQVFKTGIGALAKYTLVAGDTIVKKPAKLSWEEGAAFGVAACTGYEMLEKANLLENKGKRVFVNGGSGGVGTFLIQLAKANGHYVVATCSEKSQHLVESLGTDETVDYRAGKLDETLANRFPAGTDKAFDALLDTVGTSVLHGQSERYLKTGGTYVNVGAAINSASDVVGVTTSIVKSMLLPRFLGGTSTPYNFISLSKFRPGLDYFVQLVEEGKLKPVIDSTYAFSDVLKAYEKQMSGRAKGKVVVSVDE